MWFRKRLPGIDLDVNIKIKPKHGWKIAKSALAELTSILEGALEESRKPGQADLGIELLMNNLAGLIRREAVRLSSAGELVESDDPIGPEYSFIQTERPIDIDLKLPNERED